MSAFDPKRTSGGGFSVHPVHCRASENPTLKSPLSREWKRTTPTINRKKQTQRAKWSRQPKKQNPAKPKSPPTQKNEIRRSLRMDRRRQVARRAVSRQTFDRQMNPVIFSGPQSKGALRDRYRSFRVQARRSADPILEKPV